MWLEIKKNLELEIIHETYKGTEKMPSIMEVTELYACGTSTAQKVLDVMCKEGTITKRKGVGYFVKPFIRSELFKRHINKWECEMVENIENAYILGIDAISLEKSIGIKIEDIYSP